MLEYHQSTGQTFLDGNYEGLGYSGAGVGRNRPDLEAVPDVGPIPRGKYKIGAAFYSEKCGPICFPLTPDGHTAHGRSGFLIHGDDENHTASHGCIVLGRAVRTRIRDDREQELLVL